jgi:hypothetical protein
MAEISNKILAFLVVLTIGLTGVTTVTLLNRLSNIKEARMPPTGRALTGAGNVSLTVQDATSIYLYKSLVDFGSGYVNTSKAACATNATLNSSYGYIDSDDNDCWTDNTKAPTALAVENDGNRNVSLTIKGPTVASFFQSQGAPVANISWLSRNNESGSCASGLQNTFLSFDGTAQTACDRLLFTPSNSDDLAVDIQVVIPAGLSPGGYSNATIEFTAAAVN